MGGGNKDEIDLKNYNHVMRTTKLSEDVYDTLEHQQFYDLEAYQLTLENKPSEEQSYSGMPRNEPPDYSTAVFGSHGGLVSNR